MSLRPMCFSHYVCSHGKEIHRLCYMHAQLCQLSNSGQMVKVLLTYQSGLWPPGSPSILQSLPVTGSSWLVHPILHPKPQPRDWLGFPSPSFSDCQKTQPFWVAWVLFSLGLLVSALSSAHMALFSPLPVFSLPSMMKTSTLRSSHVPLSLFSHSVVFLFCISVELRGQLFMKTAMLEHGFPQIQCVQGTLASQHNCAQQYSQPCSVHQAQGEKPNKLKTSFYLIGKENKGNKIKPQTNKTGSLSEHMLSGDMVRCLIL